MTSVVFGIKAPLTVTDVQDALLRIKPLIPNQLNKSVFNDMVLGFETLLNCLPDNEEQGFEATIQLLLLYMEMHKSISNEHLLKQFERTVVLASIFIFGCLEAKSVDTAIYHRLLTLIYELLQNVSSKTVAKLANYHRGIIAFLWYPIDFVGDFNTQMIALRLLVMLIKFVSPRRQSEELSRIKSIQAKDLQQKLLQAIRVANYHQQVFENTARSLLINYNLNNGNSVLVYSIQCKMLRLGDKCKFFKQFGLANFWIDLNYCPRTLSFSGRCIPPGSKKFKNVAVSLEISELKLMNEFLLVHFVPPAKCSNNFTNTYNLEHVSDAIVHLHHNEVERLQHDDVIIKYFNEHCGGSEAFSSSFTDPNESSQDKAENVQLNYTECKEKLPFLAPQNIVDNLRTKGNDCIVDSIPVSDDNPSVSVARQQTTSQQTRVPLPIRKRKSLDRNQLIEEQPAAKERTIEDQSNESIGAHPLKQYHPLVQAFDSHDKFRSRTAGNGNSHQEPLSIGILPIQVNNVAPQSHLGRSQHKAHVSATAENQQQQQLKPNPFRSKGNENQKPIDVSKHHSEVTTPEPVIENSSGQQANATKSLVSDVFDLGEVSDAAPCQSYRNFVIRPAKSIEEFKSNQTRCRKRGKATANRQRCSATGRRPRKRKADEMTSGLEKAKEIVQPRRSGRIVQKPSNITYFISDNDDDDDGDDDDYVSSGARNRSKKRKNAQQKQRPLNETSAKKYSNYSTLYETAKKPKISQHMLKEFDNEDSANKEVNALNPWEAMKNVDKGMSLLQERNVAVEEQFTKNKNSKAEYSQPRMGEYGHHEPNYIQPESSSVVNCLGVDDIYEKHNESEMIDLSSSNDNVFMHSSGGETVRSAKNDFASPTSTVHRMERVSAIATAEISDSQGKAIITTHEHRVVRDIVVLRSSSDHSSLNEMVIDDDYDKENKIPTNSLMAVNFLADISNTSKNQKSLKQESSAIITAYRMNLEDNLDDLLNQAGKQQFIDIYKKNVCDITQEILTEAHIKSVELEGLKTNIKRVVSQLQCLYTAYKTKSERFQRFKENAEQKLKKLRKMDIKRRVDKMYNKLMYEAEEKSNNLSAEKWKEYVKHQAENLMQDIATLSNL